MYVCMVVGAASQQEISMEVGAAAEASFDLQDQYEMDTGSFKGSIKTIFGRQSSFFPQVR